MSTQEKIKQLDKIAAEKIEAIQTELKQEVAKLGWENGILGDYDYTEEIWCPIGTEAELREKRPMEGVDYISATALY